MNTFTWIVDPSDEGLRLDQFLAKNHDSLSRREWRQVISLGGVFCKNRRISRVSRNVRAGEQYKVFLDGDDFKPRLHLTEANILYEDDDILAVMKPEGVESQPTPARFRGTVYAAVRDYLKSQGQYATIGMHSRLDKDVSGVIVMSISRRAHGTMTDQFSNRKVDKVYLACTIGVPHEEQGVISTGISRISKHNIYGVTTVGREAVTEFRVVQTSEKIGLILFYPKTGRNHQVRVHASHLGCPIVGDRLYGGSITKDVTRLMLHSLQYAFDHPVTGEPLIIRAPVPLEMRNFMDMKGLILPLIYSD